MSLCCSIQSVDYLTYGTNWRDRNGTLRAAGVSSPAFRSLLMIAPSCCAASGIAAPCSDSTGDAVRLYARALQRVLQRRPDGPAGDVVRAAENATAVVEAIVAMQSYTSNALPAEYFCFLRPCYRVGLSNFTWRINEVKNFNRSIAFFCFTRR